MPQILLVEPDATLAVTMAKYFSKNGFRTTVCHSGQDAVILADASKPDVVILELAMPKNNGLAFLQEFRTYSDWADVPVIIYSIIPKEDAGLPNEKWQKQGVADYLYKPTQTLADLSAAVTKAYEDIKR